MICQQTVKYHLTSLLHKITFRQEAHEPHRSPEKPAQTINTFVQSYDYTISLIWKGEKTILSFSIIKWSLSTKH